MDRLLLGEDNDAVAQVASAALSSYFAVTRVGTLSDALLLSLDREPWDAVFYDLALPDVAPGAEVEALEALKAASPLSPIVVWSGSDDLDLLVSCLDAGARAIARKPAGRDDFLLSIATARHAVAPALAIRRLVDSVRDLAGLSHPDLEPADGA